MARFHYATQTIDDKALEPHEQRKKPSSSLYAALIERNADAENGSAANVASLLRDMEKEGVAVQSDVCHAALRALAVHPDAVLRGQILGIMRSNWYELSNAGWHYKIAGLIKTRQVEEALEAIDEMRRGRIAISGWLLNMMVFTLCDIGELDEALRVMQDRIRVGEAHVSAAAWYQLFDTACTVVHYDSLSFIWARQVESQYIKPSSGQCLAVLQAGAQRGDVALASSVFRELSSRGATLNSQHYELLMDAYYAIDDLKTPLTILSIMNSSGITPTRQTTRSLYQALRVSHERTQQAFDILIELRKEKPDRAIPTAAMNTILEATVDYDPSGYKRDNQNPANDSDLTTAIARYKHLHRLCPAGPTLDTFNTLLSRCAATQGHKATAMFLASEMLYLRVRPSAATYDHLLVACLINDDPKSAVKEGEKEYEDAFKYYQEMRERKWTPRPSTFEKMVKRCAAAGDQRAFVLVERMREAGIDVQGIRTWLSANWTSTSS